MRQRYRKGERERERERGGDRDRDRERMLYTQTPIWGKEIFPPSFDDADAYCDHIGE